MVGVGAAAAAAVEEDDPAKTGNKVMGAAEADWLAILIRAHNL